MHKDTNRQDVDRVMLTRDETALVLRGRSAASTGPSTPPVRFSHVLSSSLPGPAQACLIFAGIHQLAPGLSTCIWDISDSALQGKYAPV